jgi:hypothetical protein
MEPYGSADSSSSVAGSSNVEKPKPDVREQGMTVLWEGVSPIVELAISKAHSTCSHS